jgi:NhaA family Na+:H+ antiporter
LLYGSGVSSPPPDRSNSSGWSWRNAGADFIRSEVSGGAVLLVAAVLALIWANAPFGETYTSFWDTQITLPIPFDGKTESLQYWVNDLLMVLFFFVVGLEIKRELAVGELKDRSKARLPLIAALGGVILPGAIFLSLNAGGEAAGGWAIPMATDIAFAVGVLALLGKRIPSGVRVLLLSIAIVDDVIAILIIAVFYTADLDLPWVLASIAGLAIVVGMQRAKIVRIWPYWIIGAFVWVAVLSSGIHATIAGVILGLMTPAHPIGGRHVIEDLEHRLHPWTSMVIVPIFALANAGVALGGGVISDAVSSDLFWGIGLGLVVGKVLGISGAALLASRFGLGSLPAGVERGHVWGIAALGGIGFTVSIFITGLAFDSIELLEYAKIGIFAGSLVSAVFGSAILLTVTRRRRASVGQTETAKA